MSDGKNEKPRMLFYSYPVTDTEHVIAYCFVELTYRFRRKISEWKYKSRFSGPTPLTDNSALQVDAT
jgi:hypothetical protein